MASTGYGNDTVRTLRREDVLDLLAPATGDNHKTKRYRKDSIYWYKKVIASNGEDLADFEA